jgi:hypothetical protein
MRRIWLAWTSLVALLLGCSLALSACGDSEDQPPSDPGPDHDPCDVCTADQLCVQKHDGTCRLISTACVSPTVGSVDCRAQVSGRGCARECEVAYCDQPLQCDLQVPCPGESKKAFHCYGP